MIIKFFYDNNKLSEVVYVNNNYLKFEFFAEKHNSIIKIREEYYKNSRLHRFNKPAIIYYNESFQITDYYFYINGKIHNSLGPAVIIYKKNKVIVEFYINGCNIHKNKFLTFLESKINDN